MERAKEGSRWRCDRREPRKCQNQERDGGVKRGSHLGESWRGAEARWAGKKEKMVEAKRIMLVVRMCVNEIKQDPRNHQVTASCVLSDALQR